MACVAVGVHLWGVHSVSQSTNRTLGARGSFLWLMFPFVLSQERGSQPRCLSIQEALQEGQCCLPNTVWIQFNSRQPQADLALVKSLLPGSQVKGFEHSYLPLTKDAAPCWDTLGSNFQPLYATDLFLICERFTRRLPALAMSSRDYKHWPVQV